MPGLKFGSVNDSAGYSTTKVPETWRPALALECTTNYNANVNTTPNALWDANRVNFYEGEMFFDGGTYRFGYKMYHNAQIYIDDELYGDSTDNTEQSVFITEAIRPARGWHKVKFLFRAANSGAAGYATYANANWTNECGLGVSREYAYMPSKSGDKYHLFFDGGSGNLLRHDDGEAAMAELHILARGNPDYSVIHNDLVPGVVIALTAPPAPAGHLCTGFRLTVAGVVSNGAATTITYTPVATGSVPLLEWIFERQNTLSFTCDPAKGTLSTAGATLLRTNSIAVTATPAAGYRFLMWQGDTPEMDLFKATLKVPANKPRAMTALFIPDVTLISKSYIGSNGIWEDGANWDPPGAPTLADAVTIDKSGAKVLVAATAEVGSLHLGNGAILSFNATAANAGTFPRDAANTTATAPWGLRVAGDMELAGSSKLYLGGHKQANRSYVEVAGDLTLSGSGTVLGIFAGPTNHTSGVSMRYGGANLVVGGTTTIAAGAKIQPAAHANASNTYEDYVHNQGNPVVMSLQQLVVAEGGMIDANNFGYQGKATGQPNAWERSADYFATINMNSGNRTVHSQYIGGSYGGRGGGGYATFGYELAPWFPGVSGGNGSGNVSRGGGAVRIYARTILLDGTIQANGQLGSYTGGASGGGIWLVATEDIRAGRNAVIAANASQGTTPTSRGGSGGRIAIGIGLHEAQIDDLFASGYADGLEVGDTSVVGINGSVTANKANAITLGDSESANGTICGYVNLAGAHKLTVTATETDRLAWFAATPRFGVMRHDGSITSAQIAEFAYDDSQTARWPVTGYTIKADDTGALLASGIGTIVAELPAYAGDITLEWIIGAAQYKITTTVLNDAGGSVVVNGIDPDGWVTAGEALSISATTESSDMEFQYWLGNLPEAQRYSPTLNFADVPHALDLQAFFGRRVGETLLAKNQNITDWFAPASWQSAIIPGTNDTAMLGTDNTTRIIAGGEFLHLGDLIVSNAILNLNVNCTKSADRELIQACVNSAPYNPVVLRIENSLSVAHANGAVMLGGARQDNFSRLVVGGDLLLEAGVVSVNAGCDEIDISGISGAHFRYHSVQELLYGSNKLQVAGTLQIAAGATLYGRNDSRVGAAIHYQLGKLQLDEGGILSAAWGGYRNFFHDGHEISCCPSGVSLADDYNAMAYAGYGTIRNNTTSYNTAYQKYGFENAPYHPGAPNGAMRADATVKRTGGGSIRMDVGEVMLNGTITTESNSDNKGGGSGGSIWLNAGKYSFGPNALVSVKGGDNSRNSLAGGNGGGGRAALCEGLTEAQMWGLATNETHTVDAVAISPLSDKLGSRFDCSGGAGPNTLQGESGTGVYIVNTQGKVALHIDGTPGRFGASAVELVPAYGSMAVNSGEQFDFAAPAYTLIDPWSEAYARCIGWTITNMLGATLAQGSGASGGFVPTEEAVLVWHWDINYFQVLVSATTGGQVTTNTIYNGNSPMQRDNSDLVLTATPETGYRFVAWVAAGLAPDLATTPTLSIKVAQAHLITAHFSRDQAETVTWTGTAEDDNWLNAANWSGGYVPGDLSAVVVEANATAHIINANLVHWGSLELETGATLTLHNSTFSTFVEHLHNAVASDYFPIKLEIGGKVELAGNLVVGREHSLSQPTMAIGGNLTISEGGAMYLFAGWADISTASPAGWRMGGGKLAVAGNTVIAGTLYPGCEGLSGASPRLIFNRLVVEPTGKIDAHKLGFFRTTIGGGYIFNGPGTPTYQWNAASHGGIGGRGFNGNAVTPSTVIYGHAKAPYMPGSAGWNNDVNRGGGAIRIEARAVHNYGTLSVKGAPSTGSNGAGSGGTIWICAATYRSFADSTINAEGGNSLTHNSYGGPGGGGRIAIAVGLSDMQIDECYTDGAPAGNHLTVDLAAEEVPQIAGTITADGGADNDPDYPAGDGTAVYLRVANPTLLFIR